MAETIGYTRNRKIGKRLSKDMTAKLSSAQRRLQMAIQFRQKTREQNWRNSYSMYMGDDWSKVGSDDVTADLVNVNLAFSTLNTLVPFVADEDPKFLVAPYSGDATAENAAVLEAFINRMWQSSDMRGQQFISEATFDYLLYGDGYLKVGYEVKEKEVFDAQGERVENTVDVARFFVERLNPWDIWLDPFSDGLHNARWVCQRILLPIAELKDDDRYKMSNFSDGEGMLGGGVDRTNLSPEDQQRIDDIVTEDWVTIFEFYDLKDKWMLAFTTGATHPVRYIEHIETPIVQMANYRIPNAPYHMGEIEQIASLQEELNKTRSQMITHRRRNVAKWIVRKHLLNEQAEEAIKSTIVNDIIPIEGDGPLTDLLIPIHAIPLSQDSYAIDAQIRSDISEITGVNDFLRGTSPSVSKTATEATIVEGVTNTRTRHKLLQVERAARGVGQLLLDIVRDVIPTTDFEEIRQFITGREADKLNRAQGERPDTDLIFEPTIETFQGRYEVEVERGSTELRNPFVKAQKLMQMVQMMLGAMPVLAQMQINFNLQHLMELWFEAEGVDDVDALFVPSEEQQTAQQLALQEQAANAQGGQAEADLSGPAGRSFPGQPRESTALPPTGPIDESNSGILAPTR